jgi:hypothetical protein
MIRGEIIDLMVGNTQTLYDNPISAKPWPARGTK